MNRIKKSEAHHRVISRLLFIIFLSAWAPSSIAHTLDPHQSAPDATGQQVNPSDHCPYCAIQLTSFTPAVASYITWTSVVVSVAPVVSIPGFTPGSFSRFSSRAPPVC